MGCTNSKSKQRKDPFSQHNTEQKFKQIGINTSNGLNMYAAAQTNQASLKSYQASTHTEELKNKIKNTDQNSFKLNPEEKQEIPYYIQNSRLNAQKNRINLQQNYRQRISRQFQQSSQIKKALNNNKNAIQNRDKKQCYFQKVESIEGHPNSSPINPTVQPVRLLVPGYNSSPIIVKLSKQKIDQESLASENTKKIEHSQILKISNIQSNPESNANADIHSNMNNDTKKRMRIDTNIVGIFPNAQNKDKRIRSQLEPAVHKNEQQGHPREIRSQYQDRIVDEENRACNIKKQSQICKEIQGNCSEQAVAARQPIKIRKVWHFN